MRSFIYLIAFWKCNSATDYNFGVMSGLNRCVDSMHREQYFHLFLFSIGIHGIVTSTTSSQNIRESNPTGCANLSDVGISGKIANNASRNFFS